MERSSVLNMLLSVFLHPGLAEDLKDKAPDRGHTAW
jgi:hypothetical protein